MSDSREQGVSIEEGALQGEALLAELTEAILLKVRFKEDVSDDILRGCLANNPLALQFFVTRYQNVVFGYLSRMLGSGPHVEDLAQVTFLRAIRGLPRFKSKRGKLSTWLVRIAHNAGIDWLRKELRDRERERLMTDEDHMSPPASPEQVSTDREVARAIQDAMDQLSEVERDTFLLVEVEGLSSDEVAARHNVTPGTVRSRHSRARERLRVLLKKFRRNE